MTLVLQDICRVVDGVTHLSHIDLALELGIRPEFLTFVAAMKPGAVEVGIDNMADVGNFTLVTAPAPVAPARSAVARRARASSSLGQGREG